MIELRSVSFGYPDAVQPLLNNVSLSIKDGERVVVLGASGSGKTTLLRMLAGFIAPQKGQVLFDGVCVAEASRVLIPPRRRNTAMVFQDFALWPHMNVEENIAFGLKMRGVSRAKQHEAVNRFLSMVRLEGYNTRNIRTLSGGEQQRVALARALIVSPKLLLMDEPLSNLDETQNLHLRDEIISLQTELETTLLYVTHNRDEAKAVATRIVTMESLSLS